MAVLDMRFQPSIYDLANLQQMQTGLTPLVDVAQAQADIGKQRFADELVKQRQAAALAQHHANALAEMAVKNKFDEGQKELDRQNELNRQRMANASADKRFVIEQGAKYFENIAGRGEKEKDRQAHLKEVRLVQKEYDERAEKRAQRELNKLREEGFIKQGINRVPGETDEKYFSRAPGEVKDRGVSEMSALGGVVQGLEEEFQRVAGAWKLKKENDADKVARAFYKIKPGADIPANKRADFDTLKLETMAKMVVPEDVSSQVESLKRGIGTYSKMYDDVYDTYKHQGGLISALIKQDPRAASLALKRGGVGGGGGGNVPGGYPALGAQSGAGAAGAGSGNYYGDPFAPGRGVLAPGTPVKPAAADPVVQDFPGVFTNVAKALGGVYDTATRLPVALAKNAKTFAVGGNWTSLDPREVYKDSMLSKAATAIQDGSALSKLGLPDAVTARGTGGVSPNLMPTLTSGLGPLADLGGRPAPAAAGPAPLVPGNINLYNRPNVRLPDGSNATVLSASFGMPEGEVLLPTISDDGRVMSDREAVEQYRRTGKHLGIFRTKQEADQFGIQLHNSQEREYSPENFALGAATGIQAPNGQGLDALRSMGTNQMVGPSFAPGRPQVQPAPSVLDIFGGGGVFPNLYRQEAPQSPVWLGGPDELIGRSAPPPPYVRPQSYPIQDQTGQGLDVLRRLGAAPTAAEDLGQRVWIDYLRRARDTAESFVGGTAFPQPAQIQQGILTPEQEAAARARGEAQQMWRPVQQYW